MHVTSSARGALAPIVAAMVLLSTAWVALADDKPSLPSASCEQPCKHVEDCPKVTCECAHGTGSDVAVCDTENTHCCSSPQAACEQFCKVNNQTWTGRFTSAASSHEAPPAAASPSPSPCDEPCKEAKDCTTVSCQCAHGTAPDVAACDVKTHCCGDRRVVCEHFCSAKKDKWTGKLVEPQPRDDYLLEDPSDGDDGDTGGDDDEP